MAIEIAVDLDGTVLEDAFPKLGKPITENIQKLKEWKDKGYRITIFTARIHKAGEEEKIRKFLTEHDIPFDKITNIKPHTATVFIDDRAIPVSYNEPWPEDITNKIEEVISMHKEASIKRAINSFQDVKSNKKTYPIKKIQAIDASLKKTNEQVLISVNRLNGINPLPLGRGSSQTKT